MLQNVIRCATSSKITHILCGQIRKMTQHSSALQSVKYGLLNQNNTFDLANDTIPLLNFIRVGFQGHHKQFRIVLRATDIASGLGIEL